MSKAFWAALSGVGAGAMLIGAYIGARRFGVQVPIELVIVAAGALAFAGTVAVFSLLALERYYPRSAFAATRLNEMPVSRFVSLFRDPEKIQIFARPGMSVSEMLVRFGDTFTDKTKASDKKVVLTIKGAKRAAFNPVVLRQLFLALTPFKLEHVLLMNQDEEFVGYIPGDRASKDFTGTNAETKIADCITKVLANPDEVAALRSMNGVTRDDTIGETDDVRRAALKFWANDAVQGLVVHRHLKPVGVISKVDVLTLTATEVLAAVR